MCMCKKKDVYCMMIPGTNDDVQIPGGKKPKNHHPEKKLLSQKNLNVSLTNIIYYYYIIMTTSNKFIHIDRQHIL